MVATVHRVEIDVSLLICDVLLGECDCRGGSDLFLGDCDCRGGRELSMEGTKWKSLVLEYVL